MTLLDADGAVVEERHATDATTHGRVRRRLRRAGRAASGSAARITGARPGRGRRDRRRRTGRSGVGDADDRATSCACPAPARRGDARAADRHRRRAWSSTATLRRRDRDLRPRTAGDPLAGVGHVRPDRPPGAAPGRRRDRRRGRAPRPRADVAVVVVGLTEEQETEAVDKSTLRAARRARTRWSRAVAAAARRTVVVVNAATPVLMPWLDEVDAVLWAGLPGQEGGHAVAAALLGDIEPAGRLVTTFPAADGAAPAWSVTPVDGELPLRRGHRSSATAATTPAGRRRRRSGSATASATARGSTRTPRPSVTGRRPRGHGHA